MLREKHLSQRINGDPLLSQINNLVFINCIAKCAIPKQRKFTGNRYLNKPEKIGLGRTRLTVFCTGVHYTSYWSKVTIQLCINGKLHPESGYWTGEGGRAVCDWL